MPKSHTPINQGFPLDIHVDKKNEQEVARQEEIDKARYSPLPNATQLKQRYLFGIPLVSSFTNETMSDDAIDFYIKSAVSELEHTLDIYITPTRFKETHDYIRENFTWNYNYMKVDHSPIIDVERLELSFTNTPEIPGFVDFPMEFVYVKPQEGVVQLVPAFGTSLSGFLLSAFSGTQFHALNAIGMSNFPGGLRITYTAGFNECKIPVAIAQLIGVMASIQVLSALGPILFPQNSMSIGIDGVSQSTSTFGPKFLNDRITQLMAERDRQMEAIKGYYQKRFLVDWF